jgi:hypothetical protein
LAPIFSLQETIMENGAMLQLPEEMTDKIEDPVSY